MIRKAFMFIIFFQKVAFVKIVLLLKNVFLDLFYTINDSH